ncbi:MAG: D-alanine--D-alanine ligase [Flavobacterium sp. SCGC AAA160-P02]|nr:MAG: D-alanine--D-alanine ligase [Flavobacterium sp. SCGC AAA160-P02]
MQRTVAIVMGGYSSEINISLKSGDVVYNSLDKNKYNVYKVFILKDKWFVIHDNHEYHINKEDFSVTIKERKITFDCVFNAIHGHPGENGVLVAYFDLLGIKHTSAPYYQMAITFNKRDTLSILKEYDIKTATSFYMNKKDKKDTKKIVAKVGLPCFVKPNNGGSSIGISKVYKEENLIAAINKASQEDSEILIESFLDGTEVSVGVIEYEGAIKVLPMTEIVSKNDFFDYEAKYEGKSQEITPARISEIDKQKLEKVAKKIYEIFQMKGFSRSEFILVDGAPYFLEMNTVPGLTEESLLPKQAKEANIDLSDLFDNAIQMALN